MIEFTRKNVREMSEEIADVLNKYGFKNTGFRAAGASFYGSECTFKIQANIQERAEGVKSIGEAALENMARMHDLSLERLPCGRKLVEFKRRNHTYPFIYDGGPEGRRKCSLTSAKHRFGI